MVRIRSHGRPGGSIAAYGYDTFLVVSQVIALGGYKQDSRREDIYKRNYQSKGQSFSKIIGEEQEKLKEINVANLTYGSNGLVNNSVVKMRSYL